MFYRVIKGQEHKLKISSNIHDSNELMFPAYQQALSALNEIIVRAKAFDRTALCSELYGYSQNIIVFSGRRGQGKTSTMVSFSGAMAHGNLEMPSLANCAFEVLPPIDPTIMNENQNILGVILSRMYRLAETRWENRASGNGFSLCGPTEAQKNDLLKLFQKCLNGLNAIYDKNNKPIKSLREINELSDSSLLKQNIYELTNQLLAFIAGENRNQAFLVLQLDDTDYQVQMGYQILEDLRKFFSIPNVIILMATDMKMLRPVVLQHFLSEFNRNLEYHILETKELEKIVSKYLDKLLPPTHVVYLPKLDDCVVRNGRRMTALYEDGNGKNLLNEEGNGSSVTISAQPLILRYIYRKTGIIFSASDSYFHGIIPTTLRGLGQLLSLLSSMPDVPNVMPPTGRTTLELVEYVKRRVAILEANLPLFENYFLNEWLNAKLPGEKAEIIKKLHEIDANERIRYTMRQLENLYPAKMVQAPNETAESRNFNEDFAFADFFAYLKDLESKHREPEDICFYFSIRATFTILFHKAALRQERIAVDKYQHGELLVFDFSPEDTNIPDTYCLPLGLTARNQILVSFNYPQREYTPSEMFVMDCLYRHYHAHPQSGNILEKDAKCFSFMHFITLALSLGHKVEEKLFSTQLSQSWLYSIQMSSLAISINWDVHEEVYTTLKKGISEPTVKTYRDVLQILFKRIDQIVENINNENMEYSPMLSSTIVGILECLSSSPSGNGITAIQNCYAGLENILGANNKKMIDQLCEVYKSACAVKQELRDAESDLTLIPRAMAGMYRFLDQYNSAAQDIMGDGHRLINGDFPMRKIETENAYPPIQEFVTANEFWQCFTKKLDKMCQRCGTSKKEVRAMALQSEKK